MAFRSYRHLIHIGSQRRSLSSGPPEMVSLERLGEYLKPIFSSLEVKVGNLDRKVGNLEVKVGNLDRKVSGLLEGSLRSYARTLLGEYAGRGYVFNSLVDVVHCIAKSKIWGNETFEDDLRLLPQHIAHLGDQIGTNQNAISTIKALKHHIAYQISQFSANSTEEIQTVQDISDLMRRDWISISSDLNEEKLDEKLVGRIIGKLSQLPAAHLQSSKEKLASLCKFITGQGQGLQITSRSSPGMLILQYLSNVQYYEANRNKFPGLSLECDICPHIQIHREGRVCSITVGEIKSSSAGLADSSVQLAIRLRALREAVTQLFGEMQFILVGHVFTLDDHEATEQGMIHSDVSIYIHKRKYL